MEQQGHNGVDDNAAALTGSSGLPANETRGRPEEGMGEEVTIFTSIWTLVSSCQEKQSRTTLSKEMTLLERRQACSSHHQIVIWICF